MGLFHKKEACPVCGGEVKGLFHKKIGGKKALCKDCSAQVSMAKELLKDATPEFIKEHLEYRRENAFTIGLVISLANPHNAKQEVMRTKGIR